MSAPGFQPRGLAFLDYLDSDGDSVTRARENPGIVPFDEPDTCSSRSPTAPTSTGCSAATATTGRATAGPLRTSPVCPSDADPLPVRDWGGWDDLEAFREHYRGTYSPEARQRERAKVDWL